MQIQLRWVDPTTGQEKQPRLETPVLFGSSMTAMPDTLNGQAASRMVLDHEQVSPFHAVIEVVGGQLHISDHNSFQGTKVNRVARASQALKAGDRIQIGPFEILLSLPSAGTPQLPSSNVEAANAEAANADATPPPLPNASAEAELSGQSEISNPLVAGVGGFVAPLNGGASNSAQSDDDESASGMGADGTCNKQVGFLIKRRCGRTTPAGCKFCRNGQVKLDQSLYADDYNLYPNYGSYRGSYWGSNYYYNRDRYYYDSSNRRVDFTEADGASFEDESDQDYEMDLDAS